MIINGASRSNGKFFARHLMRADHNEHVAVVEMRGLGAETVSDAFREMRVLAAGAGCKNYFYHVNINTRADETLTPAQWAQAIDMLERQLGLDGQPRFIVEHQKEGRTHCHVVWSRIDRESGTTIHDGHNYRRHELAAREIEAAFNLSPVESTLTRDKEHTPRAERAPKDWETFRAQDTGIDPKAIKAELTDLWQRSDSGPAFAAALAERGYILARGDRRDFCVIDQAGDEHSLARRLAGVKAADVRARMADVDRDALPSVADARALARERQGEPTGSAPPEPLTPFEAVQQEAVREVQVNRARIEQLADAPDLETPEVGVSDFDSILAQTVREAARESVRAAQAERAAPGAAFEQFRAWCGVVWGHLAEWGAAVRDQFRDLLQNAPAEQEHQKEITQEQELER